MIVGTFGGVIFSVSKKNLHSINGSINRKNNAKITEHTPIYGVGMLRHQGRELQEISFNITLLGETNLKKKMLLEILEMGISSFLVIGGNIIGSHPFILTGIDEEYSYYNNRTKTFDKVDLTITLKEYVEDPKKYNKTVEDKKVMLKQAKTYIEDKTKILKEQEKVLKDKVKDKVKEVLKDVSSKFKR